MQSADSVITHRLFVWIIVNPNFMVEPLLLCLYFASIASNSAETNSVKLV